MNAPSMIPHRLFVAALSGDQRSSPSPRRGGCSPQVLVEPSDRTAPPWLEEKRRSEAVSAIALRRMLSFDAARLG